MSDVVLPRRLPAGDEPVTEELLVADLLGFADYLAEAVKTDGVHAELASGELASVATTTSEQRALHRAATIAAARYGDDSRVTELFSAALRS
jgi:hypothetical protein